MPNKQTLPDRGIVRVTFELPAEVQGNVIHLVGDFTGWEGTPMEKQPDGSWRTTVDLAPASRYEFRYLIDGTRWENDWDADDYVSNAYGQENSVVSTPTVEGSAGQMSARAGAKDASSQRTSRQAGKKSGTGTTAKQPARQGATKKPAVKKTTAKKTPAQKSTAQKSTAQKSTAQKSTAQKSTAQKSTAQKAAPTSKTAAKKTSPATSSSKTSSGATSETGKPARSAPGAGEAVNLAAAPKRGGTGAIDS